MQKSQAKIKTPREYISWSQLQLFEKSPFEYAKVYIYNEKVTNPFIELGKELAEALERDDWKKEESPDIELARILLPSYPEREAELKGEVGGVKILGKLDGFDRKLLRLGEFKTGRAEWTQKRVDEFGQLTFYSLLIYKNFGKIPNEIKLHWVPSEYDENGKLKLAGEVRTFETHRTMKDLLDMSVRIKKAWKGIIELCAEEFPAIGR
jgi:hypothetical protein